MFTLNTVLSILQAPILYDENAVFFIDFDGKVNKAHSFGEVLKNSHNTITMIWQLILLFQEVKHTIL